MRVLLWGTIIATNGNQAKIQGFKEDYYFTQKSNQNFQEGERVRYWLNCDTNQVEDVYLTQRGDEYFLIGDPI